MIAKAREIFQAAHDQYKAAYDTFLANALAKAHWFARRTGPWSHWTRSTESWVPWDPAPITRARLAARRLSP